jgi:hypothetical protein
MVDRNLAFDIGDALPLASAKGCGTCDLTDDERHTLALSIVHLLKVWGWEFSHPGLWGNPASSPALKMDELNASNDG